MAAAARQHRCAARRWPGGTGRRGWVAAWVWGASTLIVAAWLAAAIVRDLLDRRAGVDVIALLAMLGALALGEQLAGAVIAVMLTGGQWLEERAAGRARRALRALLDRAPRSANLVVTTGVRSVPVERVGPGDLVLVRTGELVPVDGVLVDGRAVLDESALTGESRPVTRATNERIASGAVNAGPPVQLRAVATAAGSAYAGMSGWCAPPPPTARRSRAWPTGTPWRSSR